MRDSTASAAGDAAAGIRVVFADEHQGPRDEPCVHVAVTARYLSQLGDDHPSFGRDVVAAVKERIRPALAVQADDAAQNVSGYTFFGPPSPYEGELPRRFRAERMRWDADAWAVYDDRAWRLSANGKFEMEPQSSSRTEAYLRKHTFTKDEAVRLARAAADSTTTEA